MKGEIAKKIAMEDGKKEKEKQLKEMKQDCQYCGKRFVETWST